MGIKASLVIMIQIFIILRVLIQINPKSVCIGVRMTMSLREISFCQARNPKDEGATGAEVLG
jgi:hypothetical protein